MVTTNTSSPTRKTSNHPEGRWAPPFGISVFVPITKRASPMTETTTHLPAKIEPSSSVAALTTYLDQVAPAPSIGKLVKFAKTGEFLKGQDAEVIRDGTVAVAACDLALRGYILWLDNKPAEQKLVLLSSG